MLQQASEHDRYEEGARCADCSEAGNEHHIHDYRRWKEPDENPADRTCRFAAINACRNKSRNAMHANAQICSEVGSARPVFI